MLDGVTHPGLNDTAWLIDKVWRLTGGPANVRSSQIILLPSGRIGAGWATGLIWWEASGGRLRLMDQAGTPRVAFTCPLEPVEILQGRTASGQAECRLEQLRRLPAAIDAPAPAPAPSGRRNLVILRAGPDSLHAAWLHGCPTDARNWDLCLCTYDRPPPDGPAEHRLHVPGSKFEGLAAMLTAESFWLAYDHVWFPDDDLISDWRGINRLFALCRTLRSCARATGAVAGKLRQSSRYALRGRHAAAFHHLRGDHGTGVLRCGAPSSRANLCHQPERLWAGPPLAGNDRCAAHRVRHHRCRGCAARATQSSRCPGAGRRRPTSRRRYFAAPRTRPDLRVRPELFSLATWKPIEFIDVGAARPVMPTASLRSAGRHQPRQPSLRDLRLAGSGRGSGPASCRAILLWGNFRGGEPTDRRATGGSVAPLAGSRARTDLLWLYGSSAFGCTCSAIPSCCR